jgi:hypothetical protein
MKDKKAEIFDTMSKDVFERARLYINRMDDSVEGSGGNRAMFAVCSALVNGFALGEADALALALEWNQGHALPPWPEKDLRRMVESAQRKGSEKGVGYLLQGGEADVVRRENKSIPAAPVRREEAIPPFDGEKLRRVIQAAPVAAGTPEWWMERSPVDVRGLDAGKFLEALFLPGERILVFTDMRSQGDFLYEVGRGGYRLSAEREVKAVRSDLPVRAPEGVWFLNQPVTGQWTPNAERKYSRRSEGNVTRWCHLVVESDSAPGDEWLRFLSIWPGARIRAIYSSGGRSWHALLGVDYASKADMDVDLASAKRTLPVLGADGRALTAVRLTRLPFCKRGMREQRLIYLAPDYPGCEVVGLKKLRTI